MPPAQVTGACKFWHMMSGCQCTVPNAIVRNFAFGAPVYSLARCVVDFIATAWEQDVYP
jgi:hypothetical protein